ncbi:Kdo hydroxylase family protein, partial [Chromobacterium piscinae]|uniref:Kdo hydroxylase family protein n=1 Tax=Chromobacterium piscinae TaxID=686831 RepID=UPI003260C5AC
MPHSGKKISINNCLFSSIARMAVGALRVGIFQANQGAGRPGPERGCRRGGFGCTLAGLRGAASPRLSKYWMIAGMGDEIMAERIVGVKDGDTGLVSRLEAGAVLHVPDFGFTLDAAEQALLNPAIADPKRKNISLEPDNGALHGVLGGDDAQRAVRSLVSRYQQAA